MDLQERTDDLKNKFQKVSSPLEEILKNASPGGTKTYAKTLLALARETMTNYELVVQAHQAQQIRQIAGATRNLLELVTWSEYCAKSSDNAKRFREDALRDLLGALQVMDNVAELAPETSSQDLAIFKTMIEEFTRQISDIAARSGITNLDSNYKSVIKVAMELGEQQATAYKNVNVLLSKFVHPTALIVNEVLDPQWTVVMMNIFLEVAIVSAEGSLDDIAKTNL
jgi:hypothetical protein